MLELQTGQRVKLTFSTPSVSDISLTCIVKWYEDDRVSLIFPSEGTEFIKDLPEGKEVEVVIYTNSGIFVFESIVMNSPLERDFVIELPDNKKKIQRREYIRAPINLKLVISRKDVEYETRTINIGGGGIRLTSQEKLNIDDFWKFSLFLPDGKIINGMGKVLYTLLQGNNAVSVITFTDINETDHNRLIKLCFDEEIKNLRSRKHS